MNRILYLPMEIASRELDSRLLLTATALSHGFEVVLGQKWLIESNIKRMPPGIYLSKTMTRRDARWLGAARAHGYFTAAIDEELPGLVTKPYELRWISPEAVAETEQIFISGEGNTRSFIGRFPETESRVAMALNPRWDLLRPSFRLLFDEEVAAIRAAHGDFILINTNLGFTNSEKGSQEEIFQEQVRLGKLDANNAEHIAYVKSICTMEDANKAAIIEIVAGLRKAHPERAVVIRPHPSERLATWRDAFRDDAKVRIIREGSAVAWIIAATLLIHTNCTTGTEAIALDKPAICVLPIETPVHARYLANRVNPVAHSVAAALEMAERVIASGPASFYSAEMRAIFATAMSYREDRLGAEIIMDRLVERIEGRAGTRSGSATSSSSATASATASSWRPNQRYRWHIADKNVRGALFPTLDREMVRLRLAKIAKALGSDLVPVIEYCGSKALLIGNHRMRPLVRLRRSLNSALVDFRSGTQRLASGG